MADEDITIASTTDSQEAVNEAAGVTAEEPPKKEEKPAEEVAAAAAEPEKKEESTEVAASKQQEGKTSRKGMQKRINTLTKRLYERDDTIASLSDRLTALEKGASTATETSNATEAASVNDPKDPKPTAEQFNKAGKSYEDYVEALARWSTRQERRDQAAKETKSTTQPTEDARLKKIFDEYGKQTDAARDAHDDFDDVVGNPDLKVPEVAQLAIVELPNGAEVAYHLGKHPELCDKLLTLLKDQSPIAVVSEIGRIAASLAPTKTIVPAATTEDNNAAPTPKTEQPTSRASAPIRTVGGAPTQSTKELDELPYSEYRKVRDSQSSRR